MVTATRQQGMQTETVPVVGKPLAILVAVAVKFVTIAATEEATMSNAK